MSSMVVEHFQMRKDIQSYSLGGMGCASGVLAINLVRDLLKAHPNSKALIACNETLRPSYYKGIDKLRLVTNVLFRYTMTFIESVRGVKRGDRALQTGVGSGIKCGVNVWTAVRDIDDVHQSWDHRVTEERRCQVLGDRGSSGDQLLRSGPTTVWVAVWMLLLPWATGILLVLAQRLDA